MTAPAPTLLPLGDDGVLVRFSARLDDEANRLAVALAHGLADDKPAGTLEIVPNLVSVLLRYDPRKTRFADIAGEIRLHLSLAEIEAHRTEGKTHALATVYGGEAGPDLEPLAAEMGLSPEAFVDAHAAASLRVLATGFAPGFVYCGFHDRLPAIARRQAVRPQVPAGTILFAAGQTAVTATPIPTGWHVIGRTDFRNFDPRNEPPTKLVAGDLVSFPQVTP